MNKSKEILTPWFNVVNKEDVKICGITAEYIPNNEQGMVMQKLMCTSNDKYFFTYAESLCSSFTTKSLINNLLVIIEKDDHAKIYEENYPFSLRQRLKRSVKKGELIYKHDILDISEVSFSDASFDINPNNGNRVLWIFRIGFVFGLYFDFTKNLNSATAKFEMAHLYQKVLYNDLYNILNESSNKTLLDNGWFPFIQLIGKDLEALNSMYSENKTQYISNWCNESFTNNRVKDITSRWWNIDDFISKKKPIEEGLECFYEKKYSASISTLIPMIEGIVNAVSIKRTGKGISYNGDNIAQRIDEISMEKFSEESLMFPKEFTCYLKEYFFRHNRSYESQDAVRNTVSHGRSTNDSFTRENAIKIILTLDQIFFYL